jgi:hypothetical protein
MRMPIQLPPVDRDRSLTTNLADVERLLQPSCDPNTQVSCGNGCCNFDISYCLAGRCQPYE